MKPITLLPPEDLHTRLPGETMERLKSYQQYRKERGEKWKLEDLAASLLTFFLTQGDPAFAAWRIKQRAAKEDGSIEPNGASHAAEIK